MLEALRTHLPEMELVLAVEHASDPSAALEGGRTLPLGEVHNCIAYLDGEIEHNLRKKDHCQAVARACTAWKSAW